MRARLCVSPLSRCCALVLTCMLTAACATMPERAYVGMSSEYEVVFYADGGSDTSDIPYEMVLDRTQYTFALGAGWESWNAPADQLRAKLLVCGFAEVSPGGDWLFRKDREQGRLVQSLAIAPELWDARISLFPSSGRREDHRLSFALSPAMPGAEAALSGRVVAHRSLQYDSSRRRWRSRVPGALDQGRLQTALDKLMQGCTNG